jgi:Leucine-rich repeat (LRR) protein
MKGKQDMRSSFAWFVKAAVAMWAAVCIAANPSPKCGTLASSALAQKIEERGGLATFDANQPSRPIVGVDLRGTGVAATTIYDSDLTLLRGLSQLRSLDLSLTNISDDGLKILAGFPLLEELNLRNTDIGDAGLSHIAKLKELRVLKLGGKTTSVGIARLTALKRLGWLEVSGQGVDDEALKCIGQITGLKTLDLSASSITDAGMVHLRGMTQLQTLYLRSTKITGAGLEQIRGLTQLQTLALSYPATDSLDKIEGLTRLKELWLCCNSHVNDAGVTHLRGLTELEQLNMAGTSITDASVKVLVRLTCLRKLSIIATYITTSGADELRKALPNCKIEHSQAAMRKDVPQLQSKS